MPVAAAGERCPNERRKDISMLVSTTVQQNDRAIPDTPVERLREIARRCLKGETLDVQHSQWLGDALGCYLAKEAGSLEEALGLRYGRGGVPWWREAALRERDAALRAMAETCFSDDISPCCRSQAMADMAQRYGATAWLRDKRLSSMPEQYVGTHKEYLWRAFRSGAAMPLGERQIRNITAGL